MLEFGDTFGLIWTCGPNSLWQRTMHIDAQQRIHFKQYACYMVKHTGRLWQKRWLKISIYTGKYAVCSGSVRLETRDWCGAGWQCVVLLRPPSPGFPAPALDHSPNERHLWQFSIQPISQSSIPHHLTPFR